MKTANSDTLLPEERLHAIAELEKEVAQLKAENARLRDECREANEARDLMAIRKMLDGADVSPIGRKIAFIEGEDVSIFDIDSGSRID